MPQRRSPSGHPNADVRMRGFAQRATVEDALRWLDGQLKPQQAQRPEAVEMVSLEGAAGRILDHAVESPVDVPAFARAMMDGYAVRAADTLGASAYNPLLANVVGIALPGQGTDVPLEPRQAIRIMTGAPLPAGADAVLPAEQCEVRGDIVSLQGEVSPGKHVGTVGEDIRSRSLVLPAGRRLRPQDLGVLSSIGIAQVPVRRKLRVRILVTGDELLPAGTPPRGYQIADANGPLLRALAERDGATVLNPGIVPDEREQILAALEDEVDIVLASGGSSVGQEDHVPTLLAEHGQLAVHGIAMRPSSPAGMGTLGKKLVFLLPGNPVSCLCAYDFFAARALRLLSGLPFSADLNGDGGKPQPVFAYHRQAAPLRRKLVSVVGRVDYARVKLIDGEVEPLAISGASMLSSTTRADGFVVIPGDSEGYPPGHEVSVCLYDRVLG